MTRAKRHHYVPAAYLKRFGDDERVHVRRRGKPGIYPSNVKNIAVEGGCYNVVDDNGEPSDIIERQLSRLEGDWLKAVDTIEQSHKVPAIGSRVRQSVATFLAVQFTRTPFHRERIMFPVRVAEYAGDRDIDAPLMAEFLHRTHLGFKPTPSEVDGALWYTHVSLQQKQMLTQENAMRLAFSFVDEISDALNHLNWSLEIARKPRFITSDSPLVLWRTPTKRDLIEGLGIRNSEEIRFPLSPATQLVLSPKFQANLRTIEPERVRACNADMALACYQAILNKPTQSKQLEVLDLPPRRPIVRFNTGPGKRLLPDGSHEEIGEIFHLWVPRRLTNAKHYPALREVDTRTVLRLTRIALTP